MSNCTAYTDGKKVGDITKFTPPVFGEWQIQDFGEIREVKAVARPQNIGISQIKATVKLERDVVT